MINLLYFGMAVVVGLAGSVILVLRNRRPRSVESGVQEFARELQALAPGPVGDHRSRWRRDRRAG